MTTPEAILKDALGLRRHPFTQMVDKPLDPGARANDLALFFDFYEWHTSQIISKISKQGIETFQSPADADPLMLLLSGYDKSGRKSLANLVLKKISGEAESGVLEISRNIKSNDRNLVARDLAQAFINACRFKMPEATRDEMFKMVMEDAQGFEKSSPGTGYISVFEHLHDAIEAAEFDTEIIFTLTGSNDQDQWRELYELLRPVADYIVIITGSERETVVALKIFPSQVSRFACVGAPKLTAERASLFLKHRLAQERDGEAVDGLSPFDASAINALFEPGDGHSAGTVTWQIGWLVKRLNYVLSEHINALTAIGKSADQLSDAEKVIDYNRITEYLARDKQTLM